MAEGWLKRFSDKAGLGSTLASWSRDKNFMEGAMMAAAWVAAADKTVGEREKQKVKGFIQRSELLKNFDRIACLRQFEAYVDDFDFDYGMATDKARKELGEVTDPDKYLNICRLAVAIAASEADEGDKNPISVAERGVIMEICAVRSVDPNLLNI